MHVSAVIDQRIPFSAGSFGKVLLAWQPEVEVDELLAGHPLTAYTPASIMDPVAFMKELAKVPRQGYAIDDQEEFLLRIKAISVPLRDYDGDAG